MSDSKTKKSNSFLKQFGFVISIVAVYLLLTHWVLPALGVPTCASGACAVPTETVPPANLPITTGE